MTRYKNITFCFMASYKMLEYIDYINENRLLYMYTYICVSTIQIDYVVYYTCREIILSICKVLRPNLDIVKFYSDLIVEKRKLKYILWRQAKRC